MTFGVTLGLFGDVNSGNCLWLVEWLALTWGFIMGTQSLNDVAFMMGNWLVLYIPMPWNWNYLRLEFTTLDVNCETVSKHMNYMSPILRCCFV